MTKRFFYTDALAAAWMMKHHGVKCRVEDKDDTEYPWVDMRSVGDYFVMQEAAYHIHPDSLKLLEPKVGDICMCRIHLDDPTSEIAPFRIHIPETKHDVIAILQRNGVAFMWPESESASG